MNVAYIPAIRSVTVRLIFVGLTALAVALAACGGGSSGPSTPTPKTLPLTLASAATPGPPVTPPPGTRACTSADLLGVAEAPIGLVGALAETRVDFFNASPTDCMLEGEPSIRLLDDSKAVIPAAITPGCDEPGASCPDEYPVLLGAGKTATKAVAGAVVLLDWTAPSSSTHCAAPIAYVNFIDIVIAGEDVIAPFSPPQTKLVVCGTRMSVTRFESTPVAGDKILDLQPHPSPPPTPTPSPTPDISGVRSCIAADLNATWFVEEPYSYYLGNDARINFENVSATQCVLQGTSDVTLVGNDGSPAAANVKRSGVCFPQLSCPTYQGALLQPEQAAKPGTPTPSIASYPYFEISWGNPPDGANKCDQKPAAMTLARIVLPDGETMDVTRSASAHDFGPPAGDRLELAPWCGNVYVGPILPASVPRAGPYPAVPVDVALKMNSGALEGFTFPVTLTMTNKTYTDLTFDNPCPTLTLEFSLPETAVSRYQFGGSQEVAFDCNSHRVIPRGESATFDLLVPIPTDLPHLAEYEYWDASFYFAYGSSPRFAVPGRATVAPSRPPRTPDHD